MMKLDSKEYLARKSAHMAKRKRPIGDTITDEDLASERPATKGLYNSKGEYVGRIAANGKVPEGYKAK